MGKKEEEQLLMLDDDDRKRRLIERCELKLDMIFNPILDWTDSEVWDFYWNECRHHNPLYQKGYYRGGYVGCPMLGKKQRCKEFADFPVYKELYTHSFERMRK